MFPLHTCLICVFVFDFGAWSILAAPVYRSRAAARVLTREKAADRAKLSCLSSALRGAHNVSFINQGHCVIVVAYTCVVIRTYENVRAGNVTRFRASGRASHERERIHESRDRSGGGSSTDRWPAISVPLASQLRHVFTIAADTATMEVVSH